MKKRLGRILGGLAVLFLLGMTVCAAEAGDIRQNTAFQTNSDADLHERPDMSSETTATLPEGTPVIVMTDAEDGWCMVRYREDTGYVLVSFLDYLGDEDAVDDEFRIMKEEGFLTFQEAEKARKHITSERVWGTVIVMLVTAIFGAGIVSAVRKEHKNTKRA